MLLSSWLKLHGLSHYMCRTVIVFPVESGGNKEHKADCDGLCFRLKTLERLAQRKACSRNRSIILPWVVTNGEGRLMIAEEFPIRCIKKMTFCRDTDGGSSANSSFVLHFKHKGIFLSGVMEPFLTASQQFVTFRSCSCQSRTPSFSPCGFHEASNQRYWMGTARESDVEMRERTG